MLLRTYFFGLASGRTMGSRDNEVVVSRAVLSLQPA